MPAVGGSIQEAAIRGRIFPVAADADASRQLGGWENSIEPNGDSTVRIIKKRIPWQVEGLTLCVDDARGDQEFLQDIANGNGEVDIALTFASRETYQASGTIIGVLAFNNMSSTVGVTLGGGGEMSKQ